MFTNHNLIVLYSSVKYNLPIFFCIDPHSVEVKNYNLRRFHFSFNFNGAKP